MKCLLSGFFGVLLCLVAATMVLPNYVDYRNRIEILEWLAQVKPIQATIEKKAVQQNSLKNAGGDVDKEAFQNANANLSLFEITEAGTLILRGGRVGQVVILIPSLVAEQVTWRCIGGPSHAVPKSRCADK